MNHEGYTDKRTIDHSTGGISNGLFSFLFFMYMAFRIIVVACFLLWMPFPPHPQATNTWHIRPSAILSYADQPSSALTVNLSCQKKTPLSSPQLFDRSKNNRKFEWICSTDVDQWQKWARCWKIGMWLRDPDTLILWNIGNTNRRASSPTNTPPTFLRREASTQPFAMYLFTGLCYASVQVESSNSFADIIRLRWDARASTCNVLLSHSIVNHLVKWSLQQGNLRETSVLVVLRPNFYLNGFSGFAGHLMEQ